MPLRPGRAADSARQRPSQTVKKVLLLLDQRRRGGGPPPRALLRRAVPGSAKERPLDSVPASNSPASRIGEGGLHTATLLPSSRQDPAPGCQRLGSSLGTWDRSGCGSSVGTTGTSQPPTDFLAGLGAGGGNRPPTAGLVWAIRRRAPLLWGPRQCALGAGGWCWREDKGATLEGGQLCSVCSSRLPPPLQLLEASPDPTPPKKVVTSIVPPIPVALKGAFGGEPMGPTPIT